jgi:hypothetical protein
MDAMATSTYPVEWGFTGTPNERSGPAAHLTSGGELSPRIPARGGEILALNERVQQFMR